MMRKHLFIAILLFFISCESDEGNETVEFSGGLVVLNQETWPATSTLTHYESESNTTTQSAFNAANNKELGASGNQIDIFGDYIFVPVATAGKVRILKKDLTEVATVEAFEAAFFPQYLTVLNNKLFTVWTNYTTNVLTLHDISNSKITSNSVTLEDSVIVQRYNPLVNDGSNVYSWSFNTLYKVSENNNELTLAEKSVTISPTDIAYKNNKIYASFANYTLTGNDGDNTRTRTSKGGILTYTNSLEKIDSIPFNEGVFKLGSYDRGFFALSISGSQTGTKQSWGGYSWSLTVETNMNRLESGEIKRLFSDNKLSASVSDTWVRFKYIKETDSFAIPVFEDYVSNGQINLIRLDGSIQKTITTSVAPVNTVYIQ